MAVSLIATSFAIHQNRCPAARAPAPKADPAHLLAAFVDVGGSRHAHTR